MKRVQVSGGSVQTVTRGLADPRGASWSADETILIGSGYDGIYRVAASGGTPQAVTTLDQARNEGSHRWPSGLGDGRHFVYTVRSSLAEQRGVYIGSFDGTTKRRLLQTDTDAQFVPPASLLFLDGDTLVAQTFDLTRLQLTGEPAPIAARVGRSSRGNGAFSVSAAGTLAHARATLQPGRLTWFDRSGNPQGTVGPDGQDYSDFRLSSDGQRLVVSLVDPKLSLPDISSIDHLDQRRLRAALARRREGDLLPG
jgi:Tol biopolymer transport system component